MGERPIDLRDYVDDVMLRETSDDIDYLVHRAHFGSQCAKQFIREAGLKDNEAKEQILTPNKKLVMFQSGLDKFNRNVPVRHPLFIIVPTNKQENKQKRL